MGIELQAGAQYTLKDLRLSLCKCCKQSTPEAGGCSQSPVQQWAVGAGTFCGAAALEDCAQCFQLPSVQVLLCSNWTKSLLLCRKVPKAGRGVMKVEMLFKLLVFKLLII